MADVYNTEVLLGETKAGVTFLSVSGNPTIKQIAFNSLPLSGETIEVEVYNDNLDDNLLLVLEIDVAYDGQTFEALVANNFSYEMNTDLIANGGNSTSEFTKTVDGGDSNTTSWSSFMTFILDTDSFWNPTRRRLRVLGYI